MGSDSLSGAWWGERGAWKRSAPALRLGFLDGMQCAFVRATRASVLTDLVQLAGRRMRQRETRAEAADLGTKSAEIWMLGRLAPERRGGSAADIGGIRAGNPKFRAPGGI